jgi:hypothetical protein
MSKIHWGANPVSIAPLDALAFRCPTRFGEMPPNACLQRAEAAVCNVRRNFSIGVRQRKPGKERVLCRICDDDRWKDRRCEAEERVEKGGGL